jgi:hypothetical protein
MLNLKADEVLLYGNEWFNPLHPLHRNGGLAPLLPKLGTPLPTLGTIFLTMTMNPEPQRE